MQPIGKRSVVWEEIGEESAGQRIDNYLLGALKGVPKSHVYRILRGGEVRVNSGRVDATYRLKEGDKVRIPPIRMEQRPLLPPNCLPKGAPRLMEAVIYEDEGLIALNKPAGLAVHGGSGIRMGVIEQLRQELPKARFLELAHRLDRETSGVLLIAKKRATLLGLHELMRAGGGMDKRYLVLAQDQFRDAKRAVKESLHKYTTAGGERRVRIQEDGQESHTIFRRLKRFQEATLLEAQLLTGRTHQIRVHLAHLGCPVAGDDKYGDFPWNKELAKQGLKRMFLHAASLRFKHPITEAPIYLEVPLPPELARFLTHLTPVTDAPL
jgi:23S rRNA pseudouridine955/2504/2580 synthase